MDMQNIVFDIRRKNNLTQKEFAAKLFVTRQAVSRWENGETAPSIDILKKISELFNVNANILLGITHTPICQSCAMPLTTFDEYGTNDDQTINLDYCRYCFNEGKFSHDRTIDEMIESNLRFLDEFNAQNGTAYSPDEARTVLKMHLATLKRWKEEK